MVGAEEEAPMQGAADTAGERASLWALSAGPGEIEWYSWYPQSSLLPSPFPHCLRGQASPRTSYSSSLASSTLRTLPSPPAPPPCPGKVGLPGCSVLPEGLSPFSRLGALSFRKAVGVVGPMTPALCSV